MLNKICELYLIPEIVKQNLISSILNSKYKDKDSLESSFIKNMFHKTEKLSDKNLNPDKLKKYCESVADKHLEMLDKCLKSKQSNDMNFSAIGYFMQKEEIFRL